MMLSFVRSVSCFVFVWDHRAVFTVSRDILVLQRWEDARWRGFWCARVTE